MKINICNVGSKVVLENPLQKAIDCSLLPLQ